ncbi:exported hypothetical protein [Capnocytophaga canis]|uniref:Uncharacterized protein n=1 Tax=Capnocytophaga canis TaxID=1848903 RepID=A0A0B7ID13_9FLAO|nr:exported hypothetical protein [Capnocytophaga canis]CEN49630.1 exported hypothetical protein [Capnocytophaga canis]
MFTNSWLFLFTTTTRTFFSFTAGGSGASTGCFGGSFVVIPALVSIVVVTKKNINNKNAMSAIDPAFTSGIPLFAILHFILLKLLLLLK